MLKVAAWIAMLVAGNVAAIVWRLVTQREEPPWSLAVRFGAIAVLFVLAVSLPGLRPLRGYLLALIAVVVGFFLEDLVYHNGAVQAWIAAAPWRNPVIVSSAGKLIRVAVMALTVIGLNRQNLFLTIGTLNAPSRVPFLGKSVSWTVLGPILIVVFGVLVALYLTAAVKPQLGQLGRVIVLLPVIVVFAALNAFNEEFIFRSVPLARLAPAVGNEQALWITSLGFGLAHWFGNPRGPLGVAMATVAGLFWGKSMLETGGFFWAWLIHFIQDVVIFAFLIMSTSRS
jgi:membrane protease YdiL (CAAX protease family)